VREACARPVGGFVPARPHQVPAGAVEDHGAVLVAEAQRLPDAVDMVVFNGKGIGDLSYNYCLLT